MLYLLVHHIIRMRLEKNHARTDQIASDPLRINGASCSLDLQ